MSVRRIIFASIFGMAAAYAIWIPLGVVFRVPTLPLGVASAFTTWVMCNVGMALSRFRLSAAREYVEAAWIWLGTLHCNHPHVRCVHGDEINHAGGRRSLCTRCYRYLPPLPDVCTSTGRRHGS